MSSGNLVASNPHMANFKAFLSKVGIMVEGHIFCFSKLIRVLNIYAPYSNRLEFWEGVFYSSILDDNSLIVAGDFNLTLSPD